jgi:acetyl esterase/lipase
MLLRRNSLFIVFFALILSVNVFGQNYTTRPNLEYANINGVSLRLDLYTPNNQTAPTPLIIWIHGGGWQSGTRSLGANSTQLRQANRGYAVASISYRLSGAAKFPAQIYDVKAAVRWLRANAAAYNLDPNKFAAWGSSAGGHLAALLGTSSASGFLEDFSIGNANQNSRVQAVLDWFGPTDLSQMDANALPCSVICHNCANSPESELIGCPLTVCRQKARRTNPIRYVDPGFSYPPFLIMHGTADCVVAPHQSQLLQNSLTAAGGVSTLKYIDGAGHGGTQFTSPENLALVDDFFDTNLRGLTNSFEPDFSFLNPALRQ